MSDPRRHHFHPEFYLRQWAAEDDLVCEIKKAHGKVEAQRKSPKATGFARDLYRTDGVPDEHAQHVEKNFMSPLDNDAARALQKILSGDRSIGPAMSGKRGRRSSYRFSSATRKT